MDKKTFVLAALLVLVLTGVASADLATYRHPAFYIADGKDINLNGRSIGNGSINGTGTSVSGVACVSGQYLSSISGVWSCTTPAMNLVNASGDMAESYSSYGHLDYMLYINQTGAAVSYITNPTNITLFSNAADSTSRIAVTANTSYNLTSTYLAGQFRVGSFSNVTSAQEKLRIGFQNNPTGTSNLTAFVFMNNIWVVSTIKDGVANRSTASLSITSSSKLSILANSTAVKYYIDGNQVFSETNVSYIPTTSLAATAYVNSYTAGNIYMDVLYIGWKKY